jgi:AraC family transcriptional activator of pobA
VLVERGEVECHGADGPETVATPAIAWRPWSTAAHARLSPGAVASYIVVGASALSNAIGHKPESEDVRDVAERPLTAVLEPSGEVMETFRACFSAILREASALQGASGTLIEAYLRILMIELWRTRRDRGSTVQRSSPSQRIFNQFTALVEQRFRDRWTVTMYADVLGLSRDRLGDVCRRVRGRSPKEIVDRRTEREARLLLETSTNSIEQIAALLGFQSAAQFGRFYRRMAGEAPGAARRRMSAWDAPEAGAAPLHDWP